MYGYSADKQPTKLVPQLHYASLLLDTLRSLNTQTGGENGKTMNPDSSTYPDALLLQPGLDGERSFCFGVAGMLFHYFDYIGSLAALQ